MRTMQLKFQRMDKLFTMQKGQYFNVCTYKKTLFGQDSKDKNIFPIFPPTILLSKEKDS